jgi:Ca2+-binding EF-hand superfamily protein
MFDRDGDGFITQKEIKQVFGSATGCNIESTWQQLLKDTAANVDKISFKEFESAMMQVLKTK